MVAATRQQTALRRAGWPALLCAALLVPSAASAQEAAREDGLFITVPNPLSTDAVTQIGNITRGALDPKKARRITKIVYDFNPGGKSVTSTDYGACYKLAELLLEQQQIHTIAFVHKEVTGHLVLPVLACKEIVMAKTGSFGDVPRGLDRPLRPSQLGFYHEVITGRGRNPALVLKMIDKEVEVVPATRMGAIWYIDRRLEAEEKKQGVIVTSREPVKGLEPGTIGIYTADLAKQVELCSRILPSRQEVAQEYGISASGQSEDLLQGREPRVWRIVVRGEINGALKESLTRTLRRTVGEQHRANFVILQLECGGGDPQAARDLAEVLRHLKDNEGVLPVKTVAFIPKEAPDTAVFLALGCSEIVMGKEAKLGDFDRYVSVAAPKGGQKVQKLPEEYRLLRESLEGLAEAKGYSPLLFRGMVERNLILHRVRHAKTLERRILPSEELKQDKEGDKQWVDEGRIKQPGELLVLTGDLAKELGIAYELKSELEELYTLYGLDAAKVRTTGPDWLEELSVFLRKPTVVFFLITLGITCLILELKMPGVGLPGVVAALCFVLFFWAHSQLQGQIIWLGVLLFVLGLILIGVEVFVIPGFGVTGISGILLMVVSLALVTLEKKPESTQEWLAFGGTVSRFGLSLVGAMLFAMFIARFLPTIPYASRLVLKPPDEANAELEEAGLGQTADTGPSPQGLALLGAIGVAVTPLRSAGIARFNDDFVDVVAEGSYVEPGTRVQVIEVEGNRIAVKEV